VRLRGRAQKWVMSGPYRSELRLSSDGTTVTAVNRLGIERYLYGVVPGEMPSSWPLEALTTGASRSRPPKRSSGSARWCSES
jgi:stage II sporulation protein D